MASPLAGGWLTGKYQRDATNPRAATRLGADPKRGMAAWEPRNKPERTWQILHTVEQIARAKGVIQGQVSLAWLELDQAVDGFRARRGWRRRCRSSRRTRRATVAECVRGGRSRGSGTRGGVEDLDRDPSTRSVPGLVIDRAELLGAEVGDFGLDVAFVGDGCGVELVALPVGEAFLTGGEEVPDPVEPVGLAATVALDLMLEPAAALAERYRQRLNAA